MTGRETAEFTRGVGAALGPLVVSRANSRYLTLASDERKAIYLTGSHIWNNLHDGMGPEVDAVGRCSLCINVPAAAAAAY
jgi:hypothetical protein